MNSARAHRPPGWGGPPRGPRFRRAAPAESDHFRLIRLRSALLFVTILLAMAGLAARLIDLHVVQAGALDRIAARQQLGRYVLEPRRGRLLDRLGKQLAVNADAESVFAVPSRMTDREGFAHAVAPILGVSPGAILARLRPDRHFVWLARRVTPGVAAALRAKKLGEGIGFRIEARREYPNSMLAAHVLGFAGVDNQGLAGAELAFNRWLRGQAGLAHIEHDAMGRLRLETRAVVREPRDGDDVVLTLDQIIQHIAERELDQAVKDTGAKWGTVLVMEPDTGEILAMAATPRFDPNAYDRTPPSRWNNPAVSHVYEPGSTFKIVLAAAALESRAVTEDEIFVNDGTLRVAGYTIREAHGRKYPRQTLGDILRNSSNVGAAMVATRVGAARYHETIRRFGFGAPTGIDLPGEAAGLVAAPDRWQGAQLQTVAFGQGISVTPLQLLVAGAALANDGIVVRPRLLRTVRDAEGRALEIAAPEPRRSAVSPDVARRVLTMLEEAVTRGTGTQAIIDGFPVAGKTGTAQKPSPDGGYLPDAYVASFFGIVPVDRPRLAVLVVLDEPRGAYFGGMVAAPVFRAIASQALWHLRVTPSSAPAPGP